MGKTTIKGTVIIVEDEMLLSLVEEKIVEKLGFSIIAKAMSGEDAVKKTKKYQPDILVMDVSLKGEIDGIEAVRRIRSFSNVPVIYISGSSDKQNMARAIKTGFIDYLVKPISRADMLLPMEKAIQKSAEYTPVFYRRRRNQPEEYTAGSNGQQG